MNGTFCPVLVWVAIIISVAEVPKFGQRTQSPSPADSTVGRYRYEWRGSCPGPPGLEEREPRAVVGRLRVNSAFLPVIKPQASIPRFKVSYVRLSTI